MRGKGAPGASALLALLLAAGCGSDPAGESDLTVRDSAGIEIASVRSGAWADVPAITVSGPPSLELGARDGDPARQFDQIREALLLDDSLVAVADGGSNEIRLFGTDGSLRWRAGGTGEGPGEFRALAGLAEGDSGRVVAHDFFAQRVSVLDADSGRTVRDFRLAQVSPGTGLQGVFRGGDLLVRSEESIRPSSPRAPIRTRMHLLRVAAGAPERIDTLRTLSGPTRTTREGVIVRMPFSPAPRTRLAADTVFVLPAHDGPTIRIFGGGGEELGRIHAGRPPAPVRDSAVEAYLRARSGGDGSTEEARALRDWLSDQELPDRMPAYDDLRVTGCGTLWLRRYDPAEGERERWDVLESSGWPVAAVVGLPAGFELTDPGCDRVLGIWEDDLGVQHVRLYPLPRSLP